MAKLWSYLLDMVSNQLVVDGSSTRPARVPELQEAVERARHDWLQACSYFDNVTDPDLVDHAIFCVEAAEKKYVYLLKKARSEGLRINFGVAEVSKLLSELP